VRIRSIKPEFWRSEDVTSLDWETRLVFIGMWSYVDDNGVGLDRLSSVTADLFAADLERNAPDTFARVSRGLERLAEAGRIVRYSVDGRSYIEVVNWDKHQRIDRPNKPRFPRSDAQGAQIRDTLASVVATVASGTEEQGNRGTGEQVSPAPAVLEREFDLCWQHWPKKVERKDALIRFKAAAKRIDVDELVEAVIRFGDAYTATTDRQFVPALGVWLKGDRWTDDLPVARQAPAARPTAAQRNLTVVERFAAMENQQHPTALEGM
jgi:hypothetical protein